MVCAQVKVVLACVSTPQAVGGQMTLLLEEKATCEVFKFMYIVSLCIFFLLRVDFVERTVTTNKKIKFIQQKYLLILSCGDPSLQYTLRIGSFAFCELAQAIDEHGMLNLN